MLIECGQVVRGAEDIEQLSTRMREIYWRGFVYKPGLRAGEDSLRNLSEVREEEVPKAAAELKGAYFIAVRCKESGNTYAFVDPAGLYHAYRSPRLIGTSFLELCQCERCGINDIDSEALVEFFHFGGIFEDRTLVQSIRRIDPETVIRCNTLGRMEALQKPLPDIGAQPRRTFESLLQDLVVAAQNESVSVDITGGADSRLLAVALAYFGLPFEMATSGHRGYKDIEIGARVAQALGHPHFATYHSVDCVDWDNLFFRSDALFDVKKISRFIQLQQQRRNRGVTLSLSAVAGEFFRETLWMHEFPFYTRRRPRIDRTYSLRMAPPPLQHSLLAGRYKLLSHSQHQRMLSRLARHAVPGNTQTYDRIYYHFPLRTWGGSFVSSSVDLVKVNIPFADREMVQIGYHLPRTQRMFSRFNRKMITRYSREAARIETTEGGVSATSGAWPITKDLRNYLADRSMRIINKFCERAFREKFLQPSADDGEVLGDLVRTLSDRKSTQSLADHGVLSAAVPPHDLKHHAGRIFVLDRFFELLDRRMDERPLQALRV
jgi:hypothetical protein